MKETVLFQNPSFFASVTLIWIVSTLYIPILDISSVALLLGDLEIYIRIGATVLAEVRVNSGLSPTYCYSNLTIN